jgi:hypothetical protein
MDLKPSTPAAIQYAKLGPSAFESAGLKLVSHDPTNRGFAMPMPMSFSNATPTEFGMLTNKSIVYHFSTKCDNADAFGPGSLMFMWRSPRLFDIPCPDKSKYTGDIFDVNAWLETMEDPKTNNKAAYGKYIDTADKILQEITVMGVLRGAITGSSRERSTGTTILNNVVGQRASTVNLWGYKATEGVSLHLILKRFHREGGKSVWKFVPFAGRGPYLQDLLYNVDGSKNSAQGLGGSLFIGTAMSSPTAFAEGSENIIDNLQRSQRLAGYAGGVDICVGV